VPPLRHTNPVLAPRFSRASLQIHPLSIHPRRMRGPFLFFPSPSTQREAERRQACEATSAPARCGSGQSCPLACRRPTAVLARGLTSTFGTTQAMFPGTWPAGRYPPLPVPVQRTPRAPVIVPADVMPKPPENEPYLPARGHRTRSDFRKYLRERRPSLSERL